jgi:hypothetical protein
MLKYGSLDAPQPLLPRRWMTADYVYGVENPYATFRFEYRSLSKLLHHTSESDGLTPASL